jgi:hypothetical protein
VTSGAATTALVDIEIYSPSGAKVFQRYYDMQTFVAGKTRSYARFWKIALGFPPGLYTVKIGVSRPGWTALTHWNDSAATFTVR